MELFDIIRDIGKNYKYKYNIIYINLNIYLYNYHIGLLNTYDSQFYVASMILILEYLHHQNVIFRDMKPENLMVDDQGYLKLIDLGTAKSLKGKHGMGNRTFTIIGTPHYMVIKIKI